MQVSIYGTMINTVHFSHWSQLDEFSLNISSKINELLQKFTSMLNLTPSSKYYILVTATAWYKMKNLWYLVY